MPTMTAIAAFDPATRGFEKDKDDFTGTIWRRGKIRIYRYVGIRHDCAIDVATRVGWSNVFRGRWPVNDEAGQVILDHLDLEA